MRAFLSFFMICYLNKKASEGKVAVPHRWLPLRLQTTCESRAWSCNSGCQLSTSNCRENLDHEGPSQIH